MASSLPKPPAKQGFTMHHAPQLLDLPLVIHRHRPAKPLLNFIIWPVLFGLAVFALDFYRDAFIIAKIIGAQ